MPHRYALIALTFPFFAVTALGGCGRSTGHSSRRAPTSATTAAGATAARAAEPSRPAQPSAAGPPRGQHGLSRQQITIAGLAREVAFYAPTSRSGRPPLVVAFHGTSGQGGEWVDGQDSSGIESLADQHGFVVAAPSSRHIPDSDWDHEYEGGERYWETAGPRGRDPGANPDLLLVAAVIDSAEARYGVDPKRVYALGFSNGGFFALLTAMALRDRIAAFAEAGAGLVRCSTTRSCQVQSTATDCGALLRGAAGCGCNGEDKPIAPWPSGRKVPGLVAHNNRDDVVCSAYTCTLYERMKSLGYETEVMIGNAEGHGVPDEFLPRAWSFFAAHPMP